MKDKIVGKSALAAELSCSPSSISTLVAHGLPVRSDGKLNRRQALSWIVRTCSGVGGGWEGGIRGKASIRERAVALLARQQSRKAGKGHTALAPQQKRTMTTNDRGLRLELLKAICAPSEGLAFARVMLGLGLTKEQACGAGLWHVIAPALIDLVPDEDLNELDVPSADEWRRVLGDFNVDAAQDAIDRAGTPILDSLGAK